MTNKITNKQAEDALKKKAEKVTYKDVVGIANSSGDIDEKIKQVPSKLKKMVKQVKLLFEMVKGYWTGEYREIPYYSIASAVAALLYFLSPIDLIPDFIPVIGYVDDALVVGLAIEMIQEDLHKYCAFKKYDAKQYF